MFEIEGGGVLGHLVLEPPRTAIRQSMPGAFGAQMLGNQAWDSVAASAGSPSRGRAARRATSLVPKAPAAGAFFPVAGVQSLSSGAWHDLEPRRAREDP